VESRLLGHPAARDAAVLGLPHDGLGEELGAAIVLRDGFFVTVDELREFAAQTLARLEIPTRWQFRSDLPQNVSGKVLKRQLRLEWSDAHDPALQKR
jgi:long-chain acyl-CoA synthetase